MTATTTLYDILGLSPSAREGDINAAQIRLTKYYLIGAHGLSQADADTQIQVIKEAWWVLSNPGRRVAYDASLLEPPAPPPPPPPAPEPLPAAPEIRLPLPSKAALKAGGKPSPMLIMLGIVGGLAIIGMLIQIFFSVFAFRQVSQTAGSDPAYEAHQARLMATERRLTYGDMSDKEIAEEEAEATRRRAESVQREAELREQETERRKDYARKEEERQREWALQERKRYADQVSSELQRAEEAGRRKAEEEQRRAEWEKRQKQDAERRADQEEQRRVQERVARERARWQQELQR